jgi:homoisocitrate dehydrogenase
LPGDGIGPEVLDAARAVLDAVNERGLATLRFSEPLAIGWSAFEATGAALPDATREAVAVADAALFGAVTTPPNLPGYRSPLLALRQGLELFANVRPCRSFAHATSRPDLDLLIVRENTEGMYAGIERVSDDGETAYTERVITRAASERIVRYACEQTRRRANKRLTIVHKANVLRATCGLFRRTAFEVAEEFPDLDVDELLVDACAMRLMKDPERFGTIVTTNLFGDILSDQASMLVGGLGLAASGNIGTRAAVFEPVHGSAPDIAGTGRANPLAAILSAAMMCAHLQLDAASRAIEAAVDRVLRAGQTTPDMGGELGTAAVAGAVIAALDSAPDTTPIAR